MAQADPQSLIQALWAQGTPSQAPSVDVNNLFAGGLPDKQKLLDAFNNTSVPQFKIPGADSSPQSTVFNQIGQQLSDSWRQNPGSGPPPAPAQEPFLPSSQMGGQLLESLKGQNAANDQQASFNIPIQTANSYLQNNPVLQQLFKLNPNYNNQNQSLGLSNNNQNSSPSFGGFSNTSSF